MKVSVVSDTTALIILGKLNRFDLLENIFQKVYIPKTVFDELSCKDDGIYELIEQNRLFCIKNISNTKSLKLLDGILDIGESEAIILSKELQTVLLIDEKKGRKIAKNMGIEIIGLLGLILLNVKKGFLSEEDAQKTLTQMKIFNFRISERVFKQFLEILSTIKHS